MGDQTTAATTTPCYCPRLQVLSFPWPQDTTCTLGVEERWEAELMIPPPTAFRNRNGNIVAIVWDAMHWLALLVLEDAPPPKKYIRSSSKVLHTT